MEDTKRGFEYGPRRTEQSTESSRKNAAKLLATTFWRLPEGCPLFLMSKRPNYPSIPVEESLKHHETQQRRLDELQAVIESLEAERDALVLEVREWRQCLDLLANAQEAAEQPNTQLRLEENAVQSTNDYLGELETLTAEELAELQSEIIEVPVAIPSSRERYTMQVEDWQQSLVPSQAAIPTPSLDVGF
ncbi:hypothetical protein M438DRAFT_409943, partial [Aureobasidium pullulans EXF-150]